jgi:hypothetical protein
MVVDYPVQGPLVVTALEKRKLKKLRLIPLSDQHSELDRKWLGG